MTAKSAHVTKSVIDLSTHKTCVQVRGEASDIPVVFLHSIGLDHQAFNDVGRKLGNFQSISYDQRGHGLAKDCAPSAIHLRGMADDALDILDILNIDRAHIVGHSLGGAVAATALLKDPSRWLSLSIISSPPRGGRTFSKRAKEALTQEAQEIIEHTLQRWFTPGIRTRGGEALDYAIECLQAMNIPQWAALWEALSTFPGYDQSFFPVTKKYLVIADEADVSTPPKVMKEIAENLPEASLKVCKNGGHMVPLTQPNQIAKLLFNFWKER